MARCPDAPKVTEIQLTTISELFMCNAGQRLSKVLNEAYQLLEIGEALAPSVTLETFSENISERFPEFEKIIQERASEDGISAATFFEAWLRKYVAKTPALERNFCLAASSKKHSATAAKPAPSPLKEGGSPTGSKKRKRGSLGLSSRTTLSLRGLVGSLKDDWPTAKVEVLDKAEVTQSPHHCSLHLPMQARTMHGVTSLGKISALRRCPRIMSSVNWNFADSNAVASPRSALELASARAYNVGPFSVVASARPLLPLTRQGVGMPHLS